VARAASAKGLAKLGAHVVITGRDRQRATTAVAEIKQATGNPNIEAMTADLSSLAEVRRLAEEFKAAHSRLDVLINNAGGLYAKRWETVDGIEAMQVMNNIAPFALTQALLPLLKASAPARVINVTGGMPAKPNVNDLEARQFYRGLQSYSQTKSVMMLVTRELARQLQGSGVGVFVAYPGVAITDMTQDMTPEMVPGFLRLVWPIFRLVMRTSSVASAAVSSVYAASTTDLNDKTNLYIQTGGKLSAWPKFTEDAALAQQLYAQTAQWVAR
jgi:NAD(P)-dependent dehydrogenase (short-subunit alcohol dehydrogenase family)